MLDKNYNRTKKTFSKVNNHGGVGVCFRCKGKETKTQNKKKISKSKQLDPTP